MRNPDYHPDRAHLPSAADKARWKLETNPGSNVLPALPTYEWP